MQGVGVSQEHECARDSGAHDDSKKIVRFSRSTHRNNKHSEEEV